MEEIFKNYESQEDGWSKLFQQIETKSKVHESVFGRLSKNTDLNRYINVIPYDETRVKLSRTKIDYINANYVTVSKAARRYILTQGPLPKTLSHFWLMIWEQKSNLIVMLNRCVELDGFVKCEQYWPNDVGLTDKYEDVRLSVTLNETKTHKHFSTKTITLTDTVSNKKRKIVQFNFTAWPDHGAPESSLSILRLLTAIRKTGGLERMDEPGVIHCSAGIGRSGTLALIDSVLCMIENQGSTEGIDIVQTLLEMRECRRGLIQTPAQLRFAFMTIMYGKTILERASKVQAHLTTRKKIHEDDSTTTTSTKKNRKSLKRKNSVKDTDNIFQKNLLTQALDVVDSDTGDEIFYDMMKPMPTNKKPRSEDNSSTSSLPTITLCSPTTTNESNLLRRREMNKKLAERTAEMKKKMAEDSARRGRIGNLKKSALYGSIAILFSSLIFYYIRYLPW